MVANQYLSQIRLIGRSRRRVRSSVQNWTRKGRYVTFLRIGLGHAWRDWIVDGSCLRDADEWPESCMGNLCCRLGKKCRFLWGSGLVEPLHCVVLRSALSPVTT